MPAALCNGLMAARAAGSCCRLSNISHASAVGNVRVKARIAVFAPSLAAFKPVGPRCQFQTTLPILPVHDPSCLPRRWPNAASGSFGDSRFCLGLLCYASRRAV
jgi:hypothetical protein